MIIITHIVIANGVLLCIFVYDRLERSKLPPRRQPIIIFQEKVIYPLKGKYSPAHLFDCSIVYVTPTDYEIHVSVLQIPHETSPSWGVT